MADFGGFSIPTVQELQAKRAAERRAVMTGGSPQQMRGLNIESALDSLFGNPQERQARVLEQRVLQAQQSVQPVPGENQIDGELRRLATIRDAVADISPETASQINEQLLKLGQMKLEQRKLQAEGDEAVVDAEVAAQTKGDRITQVQNAAKKSTNEGQNWWRQKPGGGIERVNTSVLDSLDIARLRKEGWVEGTGPNTEAEATDALGNKISNDLQTAIVDADNQLAVMSASGRKYDPRWLQWQGKVTNWAGNWAEKIGFDVPAEMRGDMANMAEFRQNSIDGLNRYINAITGAAVGIQEEGRIRQGYPDPIKDSPTEYETKYRSKVREILGIKKRAQAYLATGAVAPKDRRVWDGMPLPQVSEAEVDSFMTQAGFLPRQAATPAAPAATAATGVPPALARPGAAPQGSVVDRFRTPTP